MSRFIITGTDTGIGKTAVSAMLTLSLHADYWKPIQSGAEDGTDRNTVQSLTGLPDARFLPEAYILTQPLSPHRAAELDGVAIDEARLAVPPTSNPLIIEGAGGLLVPVTRQLLQIDLFKAWDAPLILCARTGLGTINHTLLSIEALRARHMPLHGLIFIGDDNTDNIRTIADTSGARVLGRLPRLERLDKDALTAAFADHFHKADFP
ncbi:dethiobiotin synthase [Asticcacaulis sp. EMRT-3]|uniref:dethiobiotin synthase n=1 Tax=Asticcacaulis sp. EMRT-3 TaxID=3040349 RepID=UPI0024AF2F25|nr:dethiobiotin synthase [Asticcacaulis sp. EMRT-3]MDI7776641.1 dethiobiotin synthase [Asticcacaulis sp. EMRT-3]